MHWKQFKTLTEKAWGVSYSPDVTIESTKRGYRTHHHTRLNKVRLIVTELTDGTVRSLKCFYRDFSVEIPLSKMTSKSIKSGITVLYDFLTTMIDENKKTD